MGTPDFAVPSLNALVQSAHEVVGVVTVPDKPRGRGQKLRPSAVKSRVLQLELPVYQPEGLSDSEFLNQIHNMNPALMVVVAFRILPRECYSIPSHGAVNLHASLLPQYRGAAPIQRAIMNGETKTGVTTFQIEASVDTGNILLQESIAIGPDENAGSVHDRLADLGADLLVATVDGLENGSLQPRPQDDARASRAPKIRKEDRRIDWKQTAQKVHNHIRALSPYPGAFTHWNSQRLQIFKGAENEKTAPDGLAIPGEVIGTEENCIRVRCGNGTYRIEEVQPPGKRRMTTEDFLNGYALQIGEIFQ